MIEPGLISVSAKVVSKSILYVNVNVLVLSYDPLVEGRWSPELLCCAEQTLAAQTMTDGARQFKLTKLTIVGGTPPFCSLHGGWGVKNSVYI